MSPTTAKFPTFKFFIYKMVNSVQVAKTHLSFFFIFLNQIKAQRDQKIIVWVEYFPYKYRFKVISNDKCHKSAVANDKCVFATCTEFMYKAVK
jgi:hypothetical protein